MSKKKRVASVQSIVRLAPDVRAPPTDDPPKNRLLASMPAADYRRLRPYLTMRAAIGFPPM